MPYRACVIMPEGFDPKMLPPFADLAIIRTAMTGEVSTSDQIEIVHIEPRELVTLGNINRIAKLALEWARNNGKPG